MSRHQPEGGFELLGSARRLEKRLRLLVSAWREFRDLPDAESLSELSAAAETVSREVRRLHRALGASRLEEPDAEGHSPTVLPARTVIEASRSLDQLLWQVGSEWQDCQRHPSVTCLSGLVERLRAARAAAATLKAALAAIDQASRGLQSPSGHGPPSSFGAVSRDRPGAGKEAVARDGADRHRARPEAAEIGALLWRISADWQSLRRDPAFDRISVLENELDEAASRVGALLAVAADRRQGELEALVRGGGSLPEGVHFHPYRDGFTGAYNRQGFDALAGAELKRCRRYGRPFGLLLLEVRPTDLERLRVLVGSLREELRGYDLLARYVDRSLVAGLPESGSFQTRRVSSRVLGALRTAGLMEEVTGLAYSTHPEDGDTLSGLLAAAEGRLGPAGTPGKPPG